MLDDRLGALDVSFLQLENDVNHMHVAGVQLFEGPPPPYEELRDHVGARLDQVPRYRQKPKFVPLDLGRARWVDDPHFRLEHHVRHTALPRPGNDEQLANLASRVFGQPLSRDRPLWELWLVEGLEDGRFALLSKTHHAVVDGIASVDVLTTLLDEEPGAGSAADERPSDRSVWEPRPAPGTARLLVEAGLERLWVSELAGTARSVASAPLRAVKGAAAATAGLGSLVRGGVSPAPDTPYNVPIGPHRRFAWQAEYLDDLKAIKDILDGSLNDVVLATVAGALGRHLRRRGEDTDGLELKVFVPVSVRAPGSSGGNEVAGIQAPLPVGERDAVRRFELVNEAMEELKQSPQAIGAQALTALGGFAPPNVLSQASRLATVQRYVNLVVTNVPGPQKPLFLLGRRLEDVFPLVPLAGNMALGVAIVSYNGRMGFGFSGDDVVMHDIDQLPGDLHAALAELAAAVDVTLTSDRDRGRAPRRRFSNGTAAGAGDRRRSREGSG